MSSIKIDAIDADWLAENVNGKVLLKAVGQLMGGKRRSKKSGDGDSTASRPVSDAMQQHHERTSKVAALLRTFKEEVKGGEREFDIDSYPKGAHLRVVSYLKSEETIDEVIEGEDMDAIEAALNFLVENPEWKPEGKAPAKKAAKPKAPAKKAAKVELSDSEDEEEAPKPKAKVAKAKAAPKPKKAAKVELSDSESEEEKPKAKKAAPAAPKPKAAESDSEEEAPKPKKAAAKPKAKADSESEEEKPKKAVAKAKTAKGSAAAAVVAEVRVDDFIKMSYEGKDYSWDQEGDGALYEGTKRVGTFDGTKATFA
jgi:outer membrane biosynthesis protein TonB